MTQQLSFNDVQKLRDKGLLKESEIAFNEEGIIVAEDIITKERRIIQATGLVLESNRRLLND